MTNIRDYHCQSTGVDDGEGASLSAAAIGGAVLGLLPGGEVAFVVVKTACIIERKRGHLHCVNFPETNTKPHGPGTVLTPSFLELGGDGAVSGVLGDTRVVHAVLLIKVVLVGRQTAVIKLTSCRALKQ